MLTSNKKRLLGIVRSSKPTDTDSPLKPLVRKRSGIYQESTEAEQLGVLPHECTRVKDVMSRSVPIVTPSTTIEEAVQLMKSLGISALVVCNGSTLVGTLSDREIALANTSPSDAIHKVMSHDSVHCLESDLLIDAYEMLRVRGLTALPVKDSRGLVSGVIMKAAGTVVMFLLLAPLIIAFGFPPPGAQMSLLFPLRRYNRALILLRYQIHLLLHVLIQVLNGVPRRSPIPVRQLLRPLSIPRWRLILKWLLLPRRKQSQTTKSPRSNASPHDS